MIRCLDLTTLSDTAMAATKLQIHTLQQHMKLHTGKDVKCTVEGCIFECRSRAELSLHLTVHSEERPFHCDDCEYSAKTKSQLARHNLIHEGVKPHRCPHCSFSSRLISQLRRHLRLHTGARPYRCPYCDYTCNILVEVKEGFGNQINLCRDRGLNPGPLAQKSDLTPRPPGHPLHMNVQERNSEFKGLILLRPWLQENLRKHVLSTNRHPGKKLYECKFCDESSTRFSTNLAKQFRAHLVSVHEAMFHTPSVASTYIAGIYDAHLDPMHIENPIPLQPRWKRGKKKACAEASSSGHFLENPDEAPDEPMSQAELSPPDRTQASSTRDAPSSLMRHDTCVDLSIQESNPGHILPMVVVAVDNTADGVIYIELPASPDGYCGSERSATTLFHGGTFLSDFRDGRPPGGAEVTVGREEVSAEDPVLVIRHL
uniref:C2H2-type domain-containing protein n=1 Tax=Timema genevievae TaxID=629358 RepID=A0A7R9JVJ5_TIMGE|nr:unnamed protein product [Timema genevievae]